MRFLLAPLNWGLGHATRSLALAQALRETGIEVEWASDGAALDLLAVECPREVRHRLPSYGISHAHTSAAANGLRIAPGLLRGTLAERRALARLQHERRYDFILSDNRYGCRLTGVPGAIVCHQVHLPIAGALMRWIPNRIHQAFLGRFDEVVVPDYPPPGGLAGRMSAPLPRGRTAYIGPLTRLHTPTVPDHAEGDPPARLAVVLSGPEPARSHFEARILAQLLRPGDLDPGTPITASLAHVDLVRGLPRMSASPNAGLLAAARRRGVRVRDFAPAAELAAILAEAAAVITRPGYTTVMDLHLLGRRAVYVPTPGQPEQAVLAEALRNSGGGVVEDERGFELERALERVGSARGATGASGGAPGEQLLRRWIGSVVARLPTR